MEGSGTGTVQLRRRPRRADEDRRDRARFLRKVSVGEGCWEWQASLLRDGYGQFTVDSRAVAAHRFAYEAFVGPIPEGMQIDHLCRNRRCVRPDHLEPVTQRVNILRGTSVSAQNAAKTLCSRGHDLNGPDGYVYPNGHRACRACRRITWRLRTAA